MAIEFAIPFFWWDVICRLFPLGYPIPEWDYILSKKTNKITRRTSYLFVRDICKTHRGLSFLFFYFLFLQTLHFIHIRYLHAWEVITLIIVKITHFQRTSAKNGYQFERQVDWEGRLAKRWFFGQSADDSLQASRWKVLPMWGGDVRTRYQPTQVGQHRPRSAHSRRCTAGAALRRKYEPRRKI